jgi:cullin-associated NEDD8-dissociated protein 1
VAECLGKLTLIDPANLLPQLQQNLSSDSPQMRSTVITAFKFTITDQPQPIDSLLKNCIQFFLQPITDADLNVRRVSLTTLNSAAHNKPGLIRDLLGNILPHLYQETRVRKELIREVEMGPFKHTVDDGLDIRKAAFECMYTLLDSCLNQLDIFEFLNHVEDGLKDHYDIKMLTYLMLVRLSSLCPNAVLQHIDRIIEPLRTTVQAKVKANSVKQEYQKQDELIRSALRAVVALQQIPDADISPMLNDFISQLRANSDTAKLFDAVQKDPSSQPSDSMDIST